MTRSIESCLPWTKLLPICPSPGVLPLTLLPTSARDRAESPQRWTAYHADADEGGGPGYLDPEPSTAAKDSARVIALRMARDLFTVSSNSASGVESFTQPPPAWT